MCQSVKLCNMQSLGGCQQCLFLLPSLLQAICVGPENLQVMYPAIFEQLLLFVEFSCKPPQYGRMETKHVANAKYNQVESRGVVVLLGFHLQFL